MQDKGYRIKDTGYRSKKLARETLATKKRYDLWAGVFDFLEAYFEKMAFRRWRKELLTYTRSDICEMGIGTGRNVVFYPATSKVFGFDISHSMLNRLRKRFFKFDNKGLKPHLELAIMDAQSMALKDNCFDTILTTFIFCTIPEPVMALQEARRVCKPGGRLVLMEHVRIDTPVRGYIMDLIDPVVCFMLGDHINRKTVENVKKAGWLVKEVKMLGGGMVNFIIAEKE